MLKRLAVFAACAMLAACVMGPVTNPDLMPRLGLGSDGVAVLDIRESTQADGTLKAAVFGQSTMRFDQQLRYRARWFDAEGLPIETSVSAWEQRTLPGEAPFDFTIAGPGPRAVRYTIDIQTD